MFVDASSGRLAADLSTPTDSDGAGVERPKVRGKFLYAGEEKLWVKGVTYGTFRPDEIGHEYRSPDIVERDFAEIAANGLNAVRTYTVPPSWLLDSAQRHGLRVMVGLPWEQHIAFLDSPARTDSIEERVRAGVRSCARHPAVLCYAVGNFSSSLAENIGYGRAGASRRDIERASEAAGLHDFISGLPEGYDTEVGERGARLSG